MFSIFDCIFVWCGKSWYRFERIDDERRCHGSDHIYIYMDSVPTTSHSPEGAEEGFWGRFGLGGSVLIWLADLNMGARLTTWWRDWNKENPVKFCPPGLPADAVVFVRAMAFGTRLSCCKVSKLLHGCCSRRVQGWNIIFKPTKIN